jgi:hypothetical protein
LCALFGQFFPICSDVKTQIERIDANECQTTIMKINDALKAMPNNKLEE